MHTGAALAHFLSAGGPQRSGCAAMAQGQSNGESAMLHTGAALESVCLQLGFNRSGCAAGAQVQKTRCCTQARR